MPTSFANVPGPAVPEPGSASPVRGRRWLRWVLGGLLCAPLLFWLGVSVAVKLTVGREAPFTVLLQMVGAGLLGSVHCALGGCEAELIPGMTLATFDDHLTEGTLVALDVDEAGRVILAESHRRDAGVEDNRRRDWLEADLAARTVDDRIAYQRDAISRGAIEAQDHFTRESDRLVVVSDRDGDGRADHRAELAAWNEEVTGIIAGVEAREGTIWVTSIPSIYRIEDENGDGVAEAEQELHRGFGVKTSLSGHDLHGLAWGPDGKLYFSVGDRGYSVALADGRVLEPPLGPGRGAVFRMNPDGSELEVFATGLRNPQELAFDDHGNLFTGDNNGDGGDPARLVYVVEGGETGWAMPYQSLADDYVRGPWMAERLFDLQHATQPAWIVPPVAQIGNGPSGFVHYPGLGLPERYANHFFLCDYAYVYGRSGIWSFALEPKGAGFALVDQHPFIWSVLTPDFDFSWDGRMFAALYDQMGDSRGISVFEHREARSDPRVAEAARIARTRMAEQETTDLLRWLASPDQRIRLRAQFELARRREIASLAAVAGDPAASELARIHAIWGLGQIGSEGLAALETTSREIASAPAELRAQLLRVIGDARAIDGRGFALAALADEAPRVRFFAAQALGRLADRESIDGLFEVLRENADRDVFLRHAAVRALERIGDLEAVLARRGDPSRSVRLAALLVLRRASDPRIAGFLADADPLLVVEAARAIYDGPIDGAMPELAALAQDLVPATEGDRQIGEALHRRVIGANVRLRSGEGATALARYVADESQLESLRALALEQLARYADPPTRDLTMGFHRPLAPIERARVASVLAAEGRALVESSLGARALEVVEAYGVSPLSDAELVTVIGSRDAGERERGAALAALTDRVTGSRERDRGDAAALRAAAEAAIADEVPALRRAGRELLQAIDPEAGLTSFLAAADAADAGERQHAWRGLAASAGDARVAALIGDRFSGWEREEPALAEALEIVEAARDSGDAERASQARALLAAARPEGRRWALAGGDPAAGRGVYQTIGDCQRCHGDPETALDTGHGGRVGPALAGVAGRGPEYLLASLMTPDAQIADGFTSPSAMPPIGLLLEPRALRDLVAYLQTLE